MAAILHGFVLDIIDSNDPTDIRLIAADWCEDNDLPLHCIYHRFMAKNKYKPYIVALRNNGNTNSYIWHSEEHIEKYNVNYKFSNLPHILYKELRMWNTSDNTTAYKSYLCSADAETAVYTAFEKLYVANKLDQLVSVDELREVGLKGILE